MNFELWVSIVNSQKDFGQYMDFLRRFPSKSVGVMSPTTPTVPRPLLISKVTHLRLFLRYHKLTKEISTSALLDHVNKIFFFFKLKTIDREQ